MLYLELAESLRRLDKEEDEVNHMIRLAQVEESLSDERLVDELRIDLVRDILLLCLQHLRLGLYLLCDLVQRLLLADFLDDIGQERNVDAIQLEKVVVFEVNVVNVLELALSLEQLLEVVDQLRLRKFAELKLDKVCIDLLGTDFAVFRR